MEVALVVLARGLKRELPGKTALTPREIVHQLQREDNRSCHLIKFKYISFLLFL